MIKKNVIWTIEDLQKKLEKIEFPEFQREPTVWNLEDKQKLIDSILRQFDIASIYLYKRKDGFYECIDGRQRINAIISYLGLNEPVGQVAGAGRYYNNFKFISSDELLGTKELQAFNNKKWNDLSLHQQKQILDYKFNVLEITDIGEAEVLNLLFLRLQLGRSLNAGEKLNAMMGDMKEMIFKGSKRLGNYAFFEYLNIPKLRYSKELTAAQIAINFFSIKQEGEYKRARFVDLQLFFKTHIEFDKEEKALATLLRKRLDEVYESIKDNNRLKLRNRAIGVSTFFFINDLIESNEEKKISKFVAFLQMFLIRLKEQVGKGIDIEKKYRDLLNFQTYISQAAVEKYAIENRQKFLEKYFKHYLKTEKIIGDS